MNILIIFVCIVLISIMFGLLDYYKFGGKEKEQSDNLLKEKELFYKTCKYPNVRYLNDLLFEQSKDLKMTRTFISLDFCRGITNNLNYIKYSNIVNEKIKVVYSEN